MSGAEQSFLSSKVVLFVGRNSNYLSYFSGSHLGKSDFDSGTRPIFLITIVVACLFLGAEKLLCSPDLPNLAAL